MSNHAFIFSPGVWVGEGRITFSTSPEHIRFYTRWSINELVPGAFQANQDVEMEGTNEKLTNSFVFSDVTPTSFGIEIQNQLIGTSQGKGVIDTKTIAWEFRGNSNFEGFEVYELQQDGDYMFHAEYASPDQFRTIIDGRIWKKST
jgi:hypothetical protein